MSEKMINVLDIALNNCCSYKCDYCISNATFAPYIQHGSKYIHINNGISLKPSNLINFIRNNFKPDEVYIQLTGGEPTLHDAFCNLTLCLMAMDYKTVINTNGSQLRQLSKSDGIEYWNVWWRCSWHPEMRSIEDFKKDIEMLPKNRVLVNYIAHPKRIENGIINGDLEELHLLRRHYEVTPYKGEYNCKQYDKNSKIYENYITGLSNREIPARSVNYISIQANGDIMRCHKIKLGNIYIPEFKERYPQANVLCRYDNGNTSCGIVQAFTMLGLILIPEPGGTE